MKTTKITANGFVYECENRPPLKDEFYIVNEVILTCQSDGRENDEYCIIATNNKNYNKLGVPPLAEADEETFKVGQKVFCLFGDSGHKFWADKLKPFVTISRIIPKYGGVPDKLVFEEIPETDFYSNDFKPYFEPDSLDAPLSEGKKILNRDGLENSNHWATPPEIYNALNEEFNFDFDPCPLNGELLFDGLSVEWGTSNFCNPPYDRINKPLFIQKGYEEWKKGKTVVFLIPTATGTKQFHELILPNAEIRFVKGRISFHGYNTKGEYSTKNKGKHDSMIVIFRANK